VLKLKPSKETFFAGNVIVSFELAVILPVSQLISPALIVFAAPVSKVVLTKFRRFILCYYDIMEFEII